MLLNVQALGNTVLASQTQSINRANAGVVVSSSRPIQSIDRPGDTGQAFDDADQGGSIIRGLIRQLLEHVGENPDREGLVRTPQRFEASFEWLTRGYRTSVEDAVNGAVFEEPHDSMILVRDIELYSLCEHHLLPFFGKAHVAYLPKGRILGLSKIPRVVDVFARRLQIQERLTDQVSDALMQVLEPHGVGVVIEAYHLCMMMRGVEKQHSKTVTSALRGQFLEGKTRDEFLRLVHGGSGLD